MVAKHHHAYLPRPMGDNFHGIVGVSLAIATRSGACRMSTQGKHSGALQSCEHLSSNVRITGKLFRDQTRHAFGVLLCVHQVCAFGPKIPSANPCNKHVDKHWIFSDQWEEPAHLPPPSISMYMYISNALRLHGVDMYVYGIVKSGGKPSQSELVLKIKRMWTKWFLGLARTQWIKLMVPTFHTIMCRFRISP